MFAVTSLFRLSPVDKISNREMLMLQGFEDNFKKEMNVSNGSVRNFPISCAGGFKEYLVLENTCH